jgi:hypothetical protein
MASVTSDQIQALLDLSETEERVLWDKEVIISYKLPSGFTVLGRAACVDPEEFVLEIGRGLAREDAARQVRLLEGYLLQNILAGVVSRND